MGQLEEAVTRLEKARKLNPKYRVVRAFLAAIYAHRGRKEEAREAIDIYLKIKAYKDLRDLMYWHPFKDPEVEKFFADGVLKAGFPGELGGYYKSTIFLQGPLTGQEIRDLVFGKTVSGFDLKSGQEWWIERAKDGKAIYRDSEGSDTGKSWIDGDKVCTQWENLYGGYKDCMRVYTNPEGTTEGKDNYIGTAAYGYVAFSPID